MCSEPSTGFLSVVDNPTHKMVQGNPQTCTCSIRQTVTPQPNHDQQILSARALECTRRWQGGCGTLLTEFRDDMDSRCVLVRISTIMSLNSRHYLYVFALCWLVLVLICRDSGHCSNGRWCLRALLAPHLTHSQLTVSSHSAAHVHLSISLGRLQDRVRSVGAQRCRKV